MAAASRATYQRRRAVALGVLVVLVVLPLVLLTRGGGDPAPASGAGASTAATPAKPAPRTDVAAVAARAHVPVLCWHQIRPITGADAEQDRVYIVPPKTLDAQLGAVERAGFHTVSADQLADHQAKGTPLPKRPILLTFDDASAGQYSQALPLLEKHHQTATFFVMTVVLGKEGWLTKGEVRRLDRAGMQIGGHTWDHHAVPDYAGEDWTLQITQPKAELEKIVGHPIDAFAYPFGLWNANAFPHLTGAGFRVAFQLSDKLDATAPMMTTRRILVGPDSGGADVLKLIKQDF